LREFRARQAEYAEHGVALAGVSLDLPPANREWMRRMRLEFPLLSDHDRAVGAAFGVIHRIGVAGWNIEFVRRTTFLIDSHGIVAGVWGKVKIRGHAAELLAAARALQLAERRDQDARSAPSSP
jgi:peroxiredoxin Q/BCP